MKDAELVGLQQQSRLFKESCCPGCGGQGLSPVYQVENIPVHSNLMMTSREEALQVPAGDLSLGFCDKCGFMTNITFDSQLQNYSPIYEDQQSFSPTFNAFARQLAERLVNEYNLYNKTVVEIGCGKGDFLMLMCRLGNVRGIGIDPACVEERIPHDMRKRLMFIRDVYSERCAEVTGDMIICRHTLEHIQPTFEFVSSVRRAIGDKPDTVVFFEVPDMGCVLRELSFCDIYYEHCSYFTKGALANLFRNCGFDILNLTLDFAGQYLLIEAKPASGGMGSANGIAHDLEQTHQYMQHFVGHIEEKISRWRQYFRELRRLGKRTAIWGSGSKCVAFLTTLGIRDEVGCVIDINPHRHGKFIPGLGIRIHSPNFLQTYRPDLVVIMNPIYEEEIRQMLHRMDLKPEIMTSV